VSVNPQSEFLRDPNLLIPRKKPVGNVVIDAERGAYGGSIIRAFVPQIAPVDLIHGLLTPANQAFINGRGNAEFDGLGDKFTYPNKFPVLTEFTILFKAMRDDNGSNGGIWSSKNVSNWSNTQGINLSFRANNSSALNFKVGSTETWTHDATALGVFHDWACVWEASARQEIYLNGVEPVYESQTVAASYIESSINDRIGVYYDEGSVRSLDGQVEYLFIINKALSKEQINDFRRDPYQFLIPA